MASPAAQWGAGHERNRAGFLTRRKPSAYGAARGSTEAASSFPQCGERMATGTSRMHRARSAHAFSTVARTTEEWGKANTTPQ